MSALELRLERRRLAPGEWIRGAVVVHAGLRARQLEVRAGLYERTRDYREPALEARTGPLATGDLAAGATLPFALQLPANAPPPYASAWGELAWEVGAHADVPHAPDVHAIERIWVLAPGTGDDQLAGPGAAAAPAPADAGAAPAAVAGSAGSGAAPGHPPGWHADPHGQARLRWWDGQRWSDSVAD